MGHNQTVMGNGARRFAITIPILSSNGSTIMDLLRAAGYDGPSTCVVRIHKNQPNSALARAAFVAANLRFTNGSSAVFAATDFTTHGQYIPAGEDYGESCDADASTTLVRSTDANTVSALAVVLF